MVLIHACRVSGGGYSKCFHSGGCRAQVVTRAEKNPNAQNRPYYLPYPTSQAYSSCQVFGILGHIDPQYTKTGVTLAGVVLHTRSYLPQIRRSSKIKNGVPCR